MHRFVLEFSAGNVDENLLRELLEQRFSASRLSITRFFEESATDPSSLRGISREIVALLSDKKPWRAKHITEALDGSVERVSVARALARLQKAGLVRKVRHGVYVASTVVGDFAEIPALNRTTERPTEERIVQLLQKPKTPIELREEVCVSRQRIEQILSKLVADGRAERHEVTGERAQHVYVVAGGASRTNLMMRAPLLSESRERILCALPAETVCWAAAVAEVAGVSEVSVGRTLEELSAQGLVTTFKLGQRRYAGITARGISHPSYVHDSRKANQADVIEEFGPLRTEFLQVIYQLGQPRTLDVTYAVLPDAFDGHGYKSGQLMQRLGVSGLVVQLPSADRKHPTYKLTTKGRFATAILNRIKPPPSAQALKDLIAERRARRAANVREIQGQMRGGSNHGSPAYDAIVQALIDHGELSSPEILERMTVKFKNPSSISLAPTTLESRGSIVRLGKRPSRGSRPVNVWSCPPESSSRVS